MPLKNRSLAFPNGYSYRQPETGWTPERYSSFDSVVAQLIEHRNANPHLLQNGHSTDPAVVAMEVDNYNTRFCQAMGGDWLRFVEGGLASPPPFQSPSLSPLQRARIAAAGSEPLVEFLADPSQAVSNSQATSRARTCAVDIGDGKPCPLNGKGGWERFFTLPVSQSVRAAVERHKGIGLSTEHDDKLGVCEACLCPLRLKVHFPLHLFLSKMLPEVKNSLHPNCWIKKEAGIP